MTQRLEYAEPIDADYEDKTGLADDVGKIEQDILNEFNASEGDEKWTMKVYRAASTGKIDIHLFDCSPSDLPINDKLRSEFGTGNYLARVYKNGKLQRVLHFAVEAPKTDNFKIEPGMSAIAQAMQNQAKLLEQLINKQQNGPPSSNMMEMITAVGTLMGAFKEMMPPPPPASDPTALMEIFFRGAEFMKDMGGSSKESNFIDLIRDVVSSPGLKGLFEAASAAKPQASPVRLLSKPVQQVSPAQQVSPEQSSVNEEQKPMEPTDEQIMLAISQYLGGFVTAAARNADIGLYADLIVDNIDGNLLGKILNRPNLNAELQASNPQIVQYWAWFSALIESLKEDLPTPAKPATVSDHVENTGPRPVPFAGASERGDGNKTNPETHVGIDKDRQE